MEKPFFVLATQNPIELEGTYPLPEAQLDRFMFNIVIDYLSEAEEIQVAQSTTGIHQVILEAVISGDWRTSKRSRLSHLFRIKGEKSISKGGKNT